MLKTIEELDEDLCKYCPCTEYGDIEVNTGPWNLCEGCACDKAYKKYVEDNQDEEEEEQMKARILGVILLVIIGYAISFGIVQLLYWGICMCFGVKYVFLYGVGIWLILCALKLVFGK